jgi:hypothetical protein
MKHVHFFGCSMTAGDELIDEDIFPWKHECTDPMDYFRRRTKKLPSDYNLKNKQLAYPALVANSNIVTYNHAELGAGVQENIINLFKTLWELKPVDYVYFQITPYGRELIINDKHIHSTLQIAWETEGYERYQEAKNVSHHSWQWTVEDFMNLILVHNFLSNKGIKHKFLELNHWINDFRYIDIEYTPFRFLIEEYKKLPILNVSEQIKHIPTLLGNHLSREAHVEIAKIITDDFSRNSWQ